MTNLTIEMPDDLARSLEDLAAAQRRSVQEVAINGLRTLVEAASEPRSGSPAAVLYAMQAAPHPASSDVDALDAAIASARLPNGTRNVFSQ